MAGLVSPDLCLKWGHILMESTAIYILFILTSYLYPQALLGVSDSYIQLSVDVNSLNSNYPI